MAANDCKVIHRAAHALKGMVNFFGVSKIAEMALDLEKMGANGACTQAREKLEAFRSELARLQTDLEAI